MLQTIASAEAVSTSRYRSGWDLSRRDYREHHESNRRPRAALKFRILETTNESFLPSSTADQVFSLDTDYGPREARSAVEAILQEDVTDQLLSECFPANPTTDSLLEGKRAVIHAYDKPLTSGGSFVKLKWETTHNLPDFDKIRQSLMSQSQSQNEGAEETTFEFTGGEDPIPF